MLITNQFLLFGKFYTFWFLAEHKMSDNTVTPSSSLFDLTSITSSPISSDKKIISNSKEVLEKKYDVIKSSGVTLSGSITYRNDMPLEGPIVVYVHGTLSCWNHNFTSDLAHKLSKDLGLRSYRYDGRFDSNEFEPTHRYKFSGFSDDIDDMECVVSSLKRDGFNIWCLLGHSRGANDVLLYSYKFCKPSTSAHLAEEQTVFQGSELDSDKIAIVAIAPRFDMTKMPSALFSPEQLEQVERIGKSTWHSQRGDLVVTVDDVHVVTNEMNMEEVVTSIPQQIPILVLHGTDDELIQTTDAYAYKAARESIDLNIIEGARHAFRGKKQNKILLNTVTAWLGKSISKFGSTSEC